MNRTTATCIAGMRSKTTTGIKTHFQRPKKPRGRSLLRGFGLGVFALRVSLIINNLPWTSRFRREWSARRGCSDNRLFGSVVYPM